MIRPLVCLALLGCAQGVPPAEQELKPETSPWVVEIENNETVSARVEDRLTHRAIHVYPGQKGALVLNRHGTGHRSLMIEVGSYRFATDEFWPTDVNPCWAIRVERAPYHAARTVMLCSGR